jgi:peroxiredoxin
MARRYFVYAVALFFAVTLTLLGQDKPASSGSWSGVIINSTCSVDEAFAESAKCTAASGTGAKLVLYDDTIRQIYNFDPPATASLGDAVTVHGTLDGNTIRGASIQALTSFGLDVGQKAPAFTARDQFGREQTLATLKGSKGTVLLFYRSADWCPYCKGQLIQLQSAKARFEEQGLNLAGISYDSQAILKFFADRRKIEFPLLSDPDSNVIRAFDVLNSEAIGQNKGMARPGYFFIDTKGVIREKFFEAKYRERLTGNSVLAKLFPELGEEVTATGEAPHLQLTVGQSDRAGVPGNLVTLTADVRLPPDVHVYAPGTQGYKPIKLVMDPLPEFEFRAASYPRSKILYLPAINESVPVFEGTFRIRQELKVNSMAEFSNSLGTDGKMVAIKGRLEYQACDSKICFLPATVPVEWQLQVLPLDRQRAPEDIRHK